VSWTPRRFVVLLATVAFCFHWSSSRVQLNTNAISLAAWSLLPAGVALRVLSAGHRRVWAPVALAGVVVWGALFLAEPAYRIATRETPRDGIRLPGLRGIRASAAQAGWMRDLARAMADSADPHARLLLISHRNDINVYAVSTPFWLTPRRPATRYHELHPGITDVESVQREMLAGLEHQPPPVVVREHRFFDDARADATKARMMEHVRSDRLID
jgi:hypothetical protein